MMCLSELLMLQELWHAHQPVEQALCLAVPSVLLWIWCAVPLLAVVHQLKKLNVTRVVSQERLQWALHGWHHSCVALLAKLNLP